MENENLRDRAWLRPGAKAWNSFCIGPGEASHNPERSLSSSDIAVGSVHPISLSFVQFSLEVTVHMWEARERPVSMPVGKEHGEDMVLSPEAWGGGRSSSTMLSKGLVSAGPWGASQWVARRHNQGVTDKKHKCVCPEP